MVLDNNPPLKAIKTSLRFGSRYFWGLFIIMLSNSLISTYLATTTGPFGAIIEGWFISGIVNTYFRIVLLLKYNRKRLEFV